jgi:hypothetical protein
MLYKQIKQIKVTILKVIIAYFSHWIVSSFWDDHHLIHLNRVPCLPQLFSCPTSLLSFPARPSRHLIDHRLS